MKKILALLAGLFIAVLVALFLAPYFIPQSYLERHLAPVLADATGLELEEARGLRLSVLPEPGFAFEGVSATLPVEDGRAPRIRAERILALVDSSALMQGRLVLKKVTFEDSAIVIREGGTARSGLLRNGSSLQKATLEGSPRGEAFLIKAANDGSRRSRRALRLPNVDIEIKNGSLAFAGKSEGQPPIISGTNLLFSNYGKDGVSTLEGELRLAGEPTKIQGTAEASQKDKRTLALRLVFQSAAGQTDIDGVLSPDAEQLFSGKTQIALRSGEALARMTGASTEMMARFNGLSLGGPLQVSKRNLALSNAKLSGPGVDGQLSIAGEFDGLIRATLQKLELHGGKAEGAVNLDARQPDAVLSGRFILSNVDTLALTRAVSDFDWLSGRANLSIEFAGGGKTLDAMSETLTGKGRFAIADGAIEGIDFPLIVADAKEGEFRKWRREDGLKTPFDRLEASFTVENGVARTQDLTLTGPNVAMAGAGRTNIAEEAYRLSGQNEGHRARSR